MYYKTKLAVHNFTIYNNASHNVVCYVWNETEGGLNADEFSFCIIDYLDRKRNQKCKEVTLWSDGCGYQNRDSILSNALLQYSVKHNITIKQNYLEKGHTQMKCDSVHSCIEKKLRKKVMINVPADYITVIKSAKTSEPYETVYLSHSFYKNYRECTAKYPSIPPGRTAGDPKVNNVRGYQYLQTNIIKYKLNFKDEWMILSSKRKAACKDENSCQMPSALIHNV